MKDEAWFIGQGMLPKVVVHRYGVQGGVVVLGESQEVTGNYAERLWRQVVQLRRLGACDGDGGGCEQALQRVDVRVSNRRDGTIVVLGDAAYEDDGSNGGVIRLDAVLEELGAKAGDRFTIEVVRKDGAYEEAGPQTPDSGEMGWCVGLEQRDGTWLFRDVTLAQLSAPSEMTKLLYEMGGKRGDMFVVRMKDEVLDARLGGGRLEAVPAAMRDE